MAGQGMLLSTSDTVTTKRTIGNMIHNIDPRDVPCISLFGLNNQSRFGLQNFPNHKYEWLKDTLRVRTATLAEGMDTTEQPMDVSAGHGLRFRSGDVWQSDETGELLWVDSVSTDTVTVIRNWGAFVGGAQGTAPSSITNATTLTYRGSARLEGDDSDPSHWVSPSTEYNFSQIFQAELKVSGSEQDATTRYGIANPRQYQLEKIIGGKGAGKGKGGRAGDLMIDLENTFWTGVRIERTSGSVAGAFGGFKHFVTTNTHDMNGGTLTQEVLVDQIQACWDNGGLPDTILCGTFNKRLISSWFAGQIRTERSERIGGAVINKIETEFGDLDIVLTRRATSNMVAIVQSDTVGWVTHRPWQIQPLAVSGDYSKEQVIGEFGFVVTTEKANAIITETATS